MASQARKKMRAIGMSLVKMTWRAGSTLTPRFAARRGAMLWCKVPGNPGRRKDNRPGEGEIAHVSMPDGKRLVTESWGPADGRLVYLVHGWGGWRGQVASFVAPLVEAGMRVVAFDTLSHGDSDPGEYGPSHSTGGELINCFEAVAQAVGQPYAIIGHSLGCASAACALTESVTAQRLVLVAPSPELSAMAKHFGKTIGFPATTRDIMADDVSALAHRPWQDFDIAAAAERGALPPTLIIHDRKDKECPYAAAVAMERRWHGEHRLMTTTGHGHQRILIDPEVIAAAAEFAAA